MSMAARLLAMLAGIAALFIGGYLLGKADERTDWVASQAHAQQAAQAKTDEINTRREQVAQSREVSRERIRLVYRTVKEKVDENVKNNPAVNDCGLDADGLRNWNAANAGEAAPVPGEPDYGLSGAASGQIGKIDGLVSQPRRSDGTVRAVPRPVEEAGGVRR